MKTRQLLTMWLTTVTTGFILLIAFGITKDASQEHHSTSVAADKLKPGAWVPVGDWKCQVGYHLQHPFAVFVQEDFDRGE